MEKIAQIKHVYVQTYKYQLSTIEADNYHHSILLVVAPTHRLGRCLRSAAADEK
jgi:hypothetical protein